MRQLVLVVAVLLSAALSHAGQSSGAQRDMARNFGAALLRDCGNTDNVYACLVERGAVCEPVKGKKAAEFRCEFEVTLDFSRVGQTGRAGAKQSEAAFLITYRVFEGRKGWRATMKSARPAKD